MSPLVVCVSLGSISIHALRGEGDGAKDQIVNLDFVISIHALRGEGDEEIPISDDLPFYFNPRPPWGGRLQKYTNMQCYACT